MEKTEGMGSFSLRRENRILAIQWIFMCEATHRGPTKASFLSICQLLDKDPNRYCFALQVVERVTKHLSEIDEQIRHFSTNWNFSRISLIDLSILRVAIGELLYREDIPPVVTINEAVEISKLFSGEASKAFINGVLDRVKNTLSRSLRTASV